MKKIYSIFLLFLMMLGINTAYAGVTLGEQVTNPGTLAAGSKIVIRANKPTNAEAEILTYKFLSSLGDSAVYSVLSLDNIEPYVAYELVTATDKTVNGKPAFYLKNVRNQQYLTYVYVAPTKDEEGNIIDEGSIYDDGTGTIVTEMELAFTTDQTKATPVIITTQAEGGQMMGYDKDELPEEGANALMIIAEHKENENKLIALNYVFDKAMIASYSDYAAWFRIYNAEINGEYGKDLQLLYSKVAEVNYKGGTDPGCYDPNLVQAYNDAKTEAAGIINAVGGMDNEKAKIALEKLENAYFAIIKATEVPITANYYRIVSAYPSFADKQNGIQKAMNATYDSHLNWSTINKDDATMVWEFIDRQDGTWLLFNVGTGQYINGTNGSQAGSPWYSLGNDSTGNAINFTSLGEGQFNINKPGFNSMHTGNHNNGDGEAGGVVAWNEGKNTGSSWYLITLTEDEKKQFESIAEQSKLNAELTEIYNQAKAKFDIGSSFTVDTVSANWLVTAEDLKNDPLVAFSNATHIDWNGVEQEGQGTIANLLDKDSLTYWNSVWTGAGPKTGQYLQFKLNKKVSSFAVFLHQRVNQGNQATQINFAVSNDTTNANGWISVNSIKNLPGTSVGSKDLRYQSAGINLYGEYQYVRVTWSSANGFTHFGGFHFQPATLDPNCQNARIGEKATTLEAELYKAGQLIAARKATREAITSLKDAYEAYNKELADPTELKAKLDSIQGVYDKAASPSMLSSTNEPVFTEGQPGVYTDKAKEDLKQVLDAVKDYVKVNDANGTYTKDGINTNLENLTTAFATFKASVSGIQAVSAETQGKWYYISASEHYYDVTGKTQDTNPTNSSIEDAKYVRRGKVYVSLTDKEQGLNNATLKVTGKANTLPSDVNDDYAQWAFINLGDTAYAIMNKATGLYIGQKTAGENAGLSVTPIAFKVSEIGYATFILDGYRFNGNKTNPLHVQTVEEKVVLWNNYDLGNGSCFDIESTGESTENFTGTSVALETMVRGKLYTKCFASATYVSGDGFKEMNDAYQIATIDAEKKELTLTTSFNEPGMPFFYVCGPSFGMPQSPTAADTTLFTVNIPSINEIQIQQKPLESNGLVGNYYSGTKVAKGFGILREEDGVQTIGTTSANEQLGWNTAYIDAALIKNADQPGEITVKINGNLSTNIQEAINDAQTGPVNVYSIDGVLIKKNVKASEAIKGLAKGIYIVGNQKIAIQ